MTVYVRAYPAEPRVRPDWPKARCARWPNPNLFVSDNEDDQEEAKKICRQCPIADDCLHYAFAIGKEGEEVDGVWGGVTKRERAYWRAKWKRERYA